MTALDNALANAIRMVATRQPARARRCSRRCRHRRAGVLAVRCRRTTARRARSTRRSNAHCARRSSAQAQQRIAATTRGEEPAAERCRSTCARRSSARSTASGWAAADATIDARHARIGVTLPAVRHDRRRRADGNPGARRAARGRARRSPHVPTQPTLRAEIALVARPTPCRCARRATYSPRWRGAGGRARRRGAAHRPQLAVTVAAARERRRAADSPTPKRHASRRARGAPAIAAGRWSMPGRMDARRPACSREACWRAPGDRANGRGARDAARVARDVDARDVDVSIPAAVATSMLPPMIALNAGGTVVVTSDAIALGDQARGSARARWSPARLADAGGNALDFGTVSVDGSAQRTTAAQR